MNAFINLADTFVQSDNVSDLECKVQYTNTYVCLGPGNQTHGLRVNT